MLELVHLAIRGISMIPATPRALEALAMVDDGTPMPTKEDFEGARHEAELADREVSEGFPVLHAQALVILGALLEWAIRELLIDWLTNDPSRLQNEPFERVRIRVGEYERLQPPDRMQYVIEALERELGAPLQAGVSRFEALLAAINLSGDVPDPLRKEIFEMSQVRNVVAHGAGLVDRRLGDGCPWLGLSPGDRLLLSHKQFEQYLHAVDSYATLVICRIAESFGVDVAKHREGVWSEYSTPPPASPPPSPAANKDTR